MDAPKVTNRIELGQLIQAGVVVVSIGGAMLGGYLAIQNQAGSQGQSIAILQQEQTQMVKWLQQVQDEQQIVKKELNASLSKITDQLTDLRILMATVRDGQHK